MVSYEDLTARVVRGNLECTNGYIHILDNVIMKVSLQCFEFVNLIEFNLVLLLLLLQTIRLYCIHIWKKSFTQKFLSLIFDI